MPIHAWNICSECCAGVVTIPTIPNGGACYTCFAVCTNLCYAGVLLKCCACCVLSHLSFKLKTAAGTNIYSTSFVREQLCSVLTWNLPTLPNSAALFSQQNCPSETAELIG